MGRRWLGRVFRSGADGLAEIKVKWFPAPVTCPFPCRNQEVLKGDILKGDIQKRDFALKFALDNWISRSARDVLV